METFECKDPNGAPFAETNNYADRRWAMKTIAEKDARIAELEAALKPFADKYIPEEFTEDMTCTVTAGDLRRARAALNGEK